MKTILTLAAAIALGATGAVAQTAMTTPKPNAPVTKPKAAQSGSPATRTGRMASATTKSGKKITYDCSKKGNMNKKVCKG
ncbi:hypothetical protein [Sphingomonas sp.]|uniref:hypothetical protein n=1 Tax=Sphingomonas sp. TaxID=28214 RepID=UPI003B003C60